MVFTAAGGPARDVECVERLLGFAGRKVVRRHDGNLVAEYLGQGWT